MDATRYVVSCDLAQLVERLDDENIKALQETDPHSLEYVSRLRSEVLIYNLIVMTERYLERTKDFPSLCRVKLRRVTHLYYKRTYVCLCILAGSREGMLRRAGLTWLDCAVIAL